jgi:hypothetical protein
LSLAVVSAVNNDTVLRNNLGASLILQDGGVPLVVERGHRSASQAYNHGLDRTDADIVVFAHQDVYLPAGWDQKLLSAVRMLAHEGRTWGVLGVVGVDRSGAVRGRSWSNGLQRDIDRRVSCPTAVQSLDEIVLVLNRKSGLRFDPEIPGFHLYGTDIAQSALAAGMEAWVFDGPVVHNSLPVTRLDESYRRAYRAMQRKWRSRLPIYTAVAPITRCGWPLFRQAARLKWTYLRRMPVRARHGEPGAMARELGYE